MLKSINQPWAISDKYANRYGNTWTNLDFVFEDKILEEIYCVYIESSYAQMHMIV